MKLNANIEAVIRTANQLKLEIRRAAKDDTFAEYHQSFSELQEEVDGIIGKAGRLAGAAITEELYREITTTNED